MPEIVGEYIDRLCAVEMKPLGTSPRGVRHLLYEHARKKQVKPLHYLAAQALLERVRPHDHVFIAAGSGSPPWLYKGETDGPLGAAALARALDLGLGAKPVLINEERFIDSTVGPVEVAGESVVGEEMFSKRSRSALMVPFPEGDEGARERSIELIEKFQPKAIVFIERSGPNEKGIFHTITGKAKPPETVSHVHYLALEAKPRGILTIGIGDGGNEVGFGMIHPEAKKIQKYGEKCQCPCQSGVITVVPTDILIVAAISNWGAYGIAAQLACILKRPEVLHDVQTEYRMLEACVRAGGADGTSGHQIMNVDGTSYRVQMALIEMLTMMVKNSMTEVRREF